jgi:hypothetical protein
MQHLWYPNQFSLNLPSTAAVRRFSLLHPLYIKYQNLTNVGTRNVCEVRANHEMKQWLLW